MVGPFRVRNLRRTVSTEMIFLGGCATKTIQAQNTTFPVPGSIWVGAGEGDSRILSMQELSSDLPEKTDNTLLDSPAFYDQTSHTLFSLPLQALGFVFPDKPH